MPDPQRRWPDTDLSGLCDHAEVHHFGRALLGMGWVEDTDVPLLGRQGLFVCNPDLESELIRAAGMERVLKVIAKRGEEDFFVRFSNQPEWRERDVVDQLKRFMGTRSGRKVLYAGLLTAPIPASSIPRPLTLLLDHLASTGT